MASGYEFCSQCGARLDLHDKFCPSCGANREEPHAPTASLSVEQAPPPLTAMAQAAAYPDPPPPTPVTALPYAVVEPPPLVASSYAGFWIRVAAALIDAVVLVIGFVVLEAVCNVILFGVGVFAAGFLELVGAWLYSAMMESSAKQATFGKMAFGLKVTDLEGRRISFGRASLRFFATYVVGLILAGIGYLVVAFTPKKQGLHDLIAGTLVMRTR